MNLLYWSIIAIILLCVFVYDLITYNKYFPGPYLTILKYGFFLAILIMLHDIGTELKHISKETHETSITLEKIRMGMR